MLKKAIAFILSLVIFLSCCFTAVAESTNTYCFSIPALSELGIGLEQGDDHWCVDIHLGDTALFNFGTETVDGQLYFVSNLLPGEILLDEASVQKLVGQSGFLRSLYSLFSVKKAENANLPENTENAENAEDTESVAAAPAEQSTQQAAALSLDLGDMQFLHVIAFGLDTLSRTPDESKSADGRLIRSYQVSPKDITNLFDAIATDLSESKSFCTFVDDMLEQMGINLYGLGSKMVTGAIRTLGSTIASGFAGEITVQTIGSTENPDATFLVAFDYKLFSETYHIAFSIENEELDAEKQAQLKESYHADFSTFEDIGLITLSLSKSDAPEGTGLMIGAAQTTGKRGDRRTLFTITEQTETETNVLFQAMLNIRYIVSDGKDCDEYSLKILSNEQELFTLTLVTNPEANDNQLTVNVQGEDIVILSASTGEERKAYALNNPINPGEMSDEDWNAKRGEITSYILKQLLFSIIKVPLKTFDLNGFLLSLIGQP